MKSLLVQLILTCDFTVEKAYLVWEIKSELGNKQKKYKENSKLLNNCKEANIQNAILKKLYKQGNNIRIPIAQHFNCIHV